MKWWTVDSSLTKPRALHRPILAVLLCAAVLSATGCSLLPKEDEEEVLPVINPPKISQKPVYTVRSETIENTVRGSGKLMSMQEEPLFFTENDKRLKELYVRPMDVVKKGQVIAVLDVEDLKKQLRDAKLQFRKDELAMKETLRKKDEMDPLEFEGQMISFEEKKQAIADQQEAIGKAVLTAPYSGTIVSVPVQKGAVVKAYDPIAVIADLSQLTVAAKISKDDLEKVAIGMKATVDINAAGKHTGVVKQLPVITDDNENGGGGLPGEGGGAGEQKDSIENYLVVKLDKMPANLGRNTPLSVSIVVDRKENAILIPLSALRTIGGRTYVIVSDEQGKREVDVEVGQRTSTDAEIVKGLQPGQKVVGN
ncbi:efflux RND transporter periplasmic adaptor subunit [Paenibacillus gansuensis]|uniref:Efflux RND transporter periplasmic adaptor subunit n=1 Tax=Paenibacillus gansuensis TaxID=306542 RepID=A0ABW5PD55_9BACL